MAQNENNSSGYRDISHSQTSQNIIQSEVKDLFNEFTSLREETHRQFSTIINTHSNSINKGINALVEEVSHLQAQVSVITHERNVLIETVANLNREIRQLSTRSPEGHSLPEAEETHNQAVTDVGDYKDITLDTEESYDERATINGEIIVEEDCVGHCDTADQINQTPNDQNQLIHIDECNENTNTSEESVCSECNFAFSTRENLRIHFQNVHTDLSVNGGDTAHRGELSKESNTAITPEEETDETELSSNDDKIHNRSDLEIRERKYKCTQCPFKTDRKASMNRHIKAVHKNIRNHICDKCGNAFFSKKDLIQHRDSVHKMGEQKFKCEQCPYTTFRKSNLKRHTEIVHEKIKKHICGECEYATYEIRSFNYHMTSAHGKGDKKFKCKKCPFSSALNHILVRHNDSVHEKIKNHACSECDYAASQKSHLRHHMEFVHEKIKNHACSECDYAATRKDTLKRHMESVHRMGGEKLKSE